MKIIQFILSVSVTVLLLGFSNVGKIKTIKIGKEAPKRNYEMKTTADTSLSLESIKGTKGTLVIFSCNTCPFVIGGGSFEGWEKHYSTIAERCEKAGVSPVLVNSNQAKRTAGDGIDDMKQRAAAKNYTIPYALDEDHVLADAFGAKTTPHIFLFDAEWKLVYEGAIDNTWDPSQTKKEEYLNDAINSLESGSNIITPKTAPRGCSIKRKN